MWTNGPLAQAQYVLQQQSLQEAAQSNTWTQQGGEDARPGTRPKCGVHEFQRMATTNAADWLYHL